MKVRIVTRLTLWYVLVLAVIVGALAAVFVVRLHDDLVRSVDVELDARAVQIRAERSKVQPAERPDIADLPAVIGLSRGEYLIQAVDLSTGKVQAGNAESARFRFPYDSSPAASKGRPQRATLKVGAEAFRFLVVPASGAPSTLLILGKSLEGVEQTIRHFLLLIAVAVPGALAAAYVGGRLLAGSALRPVERVTDVAKAINESDLSLRVDVPAVDDEVARLARTFNTMLERVERALTSQRRFIADAAHELRTPLAIMRAEIDVALRDPQLGDAGRDVLSSIADEVDRLARMAENLLTLARLGEGQLPILHASVALDDVGADVVRAMSNIAAVRHQRVEADLKPAHAWGDQERLRQVAINLIDNAMRYGRDGGAIRVATGENEDTAWLRVEDDGPGIGDESLGNIFSRFYRSPDARAREPGGSGLGLAICHAIVESHHGTIAVERGREGGTVCTVTLPAGRSTMVRTDPT